MHRTLIIYLDQPGRNRMYLSSSVAKVILSYSLYTVLQVLQAKEIRSNHMKVPEQRLSKTFKIGI